MGEHSEILRRGDIAVERVRDAKRKRTLYVCHAPGVAPFEAGAIDDLTMLFARDWGADVDWEMLGREVERRRCAPKRLGVR